jgi:transcription initiation factor IIE alpha subunit
MLLGADRAADGVEDLDHLDQERAQKWELFALLLDLDPAREFTAKELAKELPYSKTELNKCLFRLYVNKALVMVGAPTNEATTYRLNPSFFGV